MSLIFHPDRRHSLFLLTSLNLWILNNCFKKLNYCVNFSSQWSHCAVPVYGKCKSLQDSLEHSLGPHKCKLLKSTAWIISESSERARCRMLQKTTAFCMVTFYSFSVKVIIDIHMDRNYWIFPIISFIQVASICQILNIVKLFLIYWWKFYDTWLLYYSY